MLMASPYVTGPVVVNSSLEAVISLVQYSVQGTISLSVSHPLFVIRNGCLLHSLCVYFLEIINKKQCSNNIVINISLAIVC